MDSVITSSIRSAFEFNGQKCSACSRMYVPQSLWPKVKLENEVDFLSQNFVVVVSL